MDKEKIVLKDGTEYQVENGATENTIVIIVKDVAEFDLVFTSFTVSNLSQFKILNSAGVLCAIILDKKLDKAEIKQVAEGLMATFTLSKVDTVEKRINDLEETVETLVMSNLEVSDNTNADSTNETTETLPTEEVSGNVEHTDETV